MIDSMVGRGSGRSLARAAAFAIVAFGVGVGSPSAASAGALERECAELDQARRTACQLEQSLTGEWVLTTRLLVGSGAKQGLASLERQFCEAMRSRGKAARVTRWSALPGAQGQAAKMEWSCAKESAPAVSTGPPAVPRYGGAYLR